MTGSDTASPAVRFWVSGICMAAAGILAPGAVIGIAAFPLLIISIAYGLRGFVLLPLASHRSGPGPLLLFTLGLLLAEVAGVLHGAMAFAWTHPETYALPPPLFVTLIAGLFPAALCVWAVDRRIERGPAVAAILLLGIIIANPVILLIGRTLALPLKRAW
jgi:hypothetical protein